jgi:hypothetical protein
VAKPSLVIGCQSANVWQRKGSVLPTHPLTSHILPARPLWHPALEPKFPFGRRAERPGKTFVAEAR